MIERGCPLCASCASSHLFEAREFVLARRNYSLVRCDACGHVFVNPVPDMAELESYYAEGVPRLRALYPLPEGVSPDAIADAPVEREKIELLQSLGLLSQPGAILDIGFGNGGFVLAMANLRWRSVGYEFTDQVDLPFDPAGRFEVLLGSGALNRLDPEQFDLITLWHVLEHLTDPIDALRTAARLLKPSGRIVVAVPNVSSLSAQLFGRYWHAISPPWHLQQFAPRSLGLAFCEAGLLVEAVDGFGVHPMRMGWTDSLTQVIASLPPTRRQWFVKAALRVLRKGTVFGAPALLAFERAIGRPGAIVAIGRRNPLLAASRREAEEVVMLRSGAALRIK